jgi:hypothetical protein
MKPWRNFLCATTFLREQRTRRMSLELLREGIGSRAAKAAGLVLAVWLTVAAAGAQVTTRTHLSVAPVGQGATFTANVADVEGNPANSGSVSFVSAKGSLGSAFVANGVATLTIEKLPQGTGSVTASYSGGTGYAASMASAAATSAATTSLPDFGVTANPSSVSLSPGDYANITITVTPENGFTNMVTLSCSGVPTTAKCLFSPTTLTPVSASAISSTLQIQTQGPSGTSVELRKAPSTAAYAVVLPGILALVGLGALRRRSGIAAIRVLGLVMLLGAGGLGLGACSERYGYLNHPPSGNPGIVAGTYTITVTGYASINGTSVTGHSLNVTMTVK